MGERWVSASNAVALVRVVVHGIANERAPVFEARTVAAYAHARALLAPGEALHPARVWNWVPRMHDLLDGELDRYHAFNRARYDVLSEWFAGPEQFAESLPTATAVGHPGNDLVVLVLATKERGRSVENPRQRPAYCYSTAHGPRPPCFARGTLVELDGEKRLLVGGTASIRGEDSVHVGSLEGQLEETFENLTSLLKTGLGESATLQALRSARVYFPRCADRAEIERTIRVRLSQSSDIEFVVAELCRPELLIEIEGVA